MVVVLLAVHLFLPGSHSLKEKRMVLRRIKDRLARFNIAVAEVDHQDLWQRAELGLVTVSASGEHAERELAAAVEEIDRVLPGIVTRTEISHLT